MKNEITILSDAIKSDLITNEDAQDLLGIFREDECEHDYQYAIQMLESAIKDSTFSQKDYSETTPITYDIN